MNEPKTPNLGLNKIDRSSPSTTYFDLDKYLDQNWEKVDGFAEQVREKAEETAAQVSNIQERLDTEKRRSVTLEPGLQVINAERTSAFKLEGLKGRTLVNLLGRAGGMESLTGIASSRVTTLLDTANKTSGSSGLKVTNGSSASSESAGIAYVPKLDLKAGSYYVLIAEAKNGNAVEGLQIGFGGEFAGPYSPAVKASDKFTTLWTKKQLSSVTSGNMDMAVVGPESQYGYFDDLRLYEISATEYAALDNLTPEQVSAKYPYVDSDQPVRNPYAIRYGENLLPPVYEWADQTGSAAYSTINGPYDVTIISPDPVARFYSYVLNVIPGKTYSLNAETDANKIQWDYYKTWDSATSTGEMIGSRDKFTGSETTFVVPSGVTIIRIYLFNDSVAGTFNIKNWMLTLGTTAKTFKPREDAMLALQTDLYADPLTGANADEVFKKDGQYFKLAKWKKVVLDGGINWSYSASSSSAGYKGIACLNLTTNFVARSAIITKYNGSLTLTKQDGQIDGADQNNGIGGGNLYLSVPNADSGWGDAYTPTADEIKAYFMGWKMYASDRSTTYDGTGTKYWYPISRLLDTFDAAYRVTATVPTTTANKDTYTPYQLIYQLATPTVEPITSEGQLTLIEGNNQVEVGTGIVLREKVNPYANSGIDQAGINAPSSPNYPGTGLKAKVRKLRTIYKNGIEDNNWAIKPSAGINGGGEEYADIKLSQYDRSATYTVTYFMLDTSPIASFIGTIDETEKALLDSLIKDLKDVNTAVPSVIGKANVLVAQGLNDAKNYADSNFRKPSEIVNANLVKNSTGQMGLTYWTNHGDVPFLSYEGNPTVGSFFGVVNAISAQQYAVLDSENIGVTPGGTYLLQGMFHTAGSNSNASVRIEVKDGNPAVDVNIAYLSADPAKWWHRKSMFIAIPAGVTSVKLRLVLSNVNYATKGFSRISLTETIQDVPYSMDRDIRALYEQNELVKQSGVDAKNRIVGAINAKGGSASANDTWPTLETKVRGIETGPKYATGLVTTGAGVFTINAYDGQTYSTAIVIVTGLGFKPNRIVIESVANQSYGFVTTFPSSSGLSPDGKQTYFIGGLNYANSKVDGVNSYVVDGGFRLGVYGTNREFRWHAYG
ncbi:hypothetical protein [Paenibacillus sp. MABNR03]|uniref:hypothetical protein n=1 Tax=Paenibacillus sp. MABNR03 TaxID=3142626 RepID=UPI003D2AD706